MRTFALLTFVLIASFGVPILANAQACTTAGAPCSFGGVSGVCVQNETGGFGCGPGTSVSPSQTQNTSKVTLINPLGEGTTLMSFLLSILNIITNTIGPIIVILMMVFVGYKFVVAQGNAGELEKAKSALLWTVVGALILLGAKVIALGIQATVQALSTGG